MTPDRQYRLDGILTNRRHPARSTVESHGFQPLQRSLHEHALFGPRFACRRDRAGAVRRYDGCDGTNHHAAATHSAGSASASATTHDSGNARATGTTHAGPAAIDSTATAADQPGATRGTGNTHGGTAAARRRGRVLSRHRIERALPTQ